MLAPDLEALEADVVHAIATGEASRLNVVGHGEISLVLGWPPTNPEVVCKRLPPFADEAGYRSYRDVVLRYIDELRGRGVRVVDTELRHLVRRDGHVVGFHVQPLMSADRLGTEVLRRGASDGWTIRCSRRSSRPSTRATDDRLGIDAQLSNWIWLDAVPWQIDLTTPFLLDDNRRPSFDLTPFLAPASRRRASDHPPRDGEADPAMDDLAWRAPRSRRQPLEGRAERLARSGAADDQRARFATITEDEARRVHLGDRRLWPLLFHLEHVNRWWQRRIRRREFDFLLPERTTYEEHRRRPARKDAS